MPNFHNEHGDSCKSSHNNKRKITAESENASVEKKWKSKKHFADRNDECQTSQSAHDFLKKLVHEQKLHAPTLFNRDGKKDDDKLDVDRSNGKLSFYLDGRFVLELVHKAGGKSNASGSWIQSKGTTWTPRPEGDPFPPSSTDANRSSESNTSRCPTDDQIKPKDCHRFVSKVTNVGLLNFRINRRRDYKRLPRISAYHVRKAARRPSAVDLFCISERCKMLLPVPKKPNCKRLKNLNDVFSRWRLSNEKVNVDSNVTDKSIKRWFDDRADTVKVKCEPVKEDSDKKTNSLPLPEWYLDPSKAQIPVSEMIGYPRPYLPTSTSNSYDLGWERQKPDEKISVVRHLIDRGGDVASRDVSSAVMWEAASKFKLSTGEVSRLWLQHCAGETKPSQFETETKKVLIKECEAEGPLDLRINVVRNECDERMCPKKLKEEWLKRETNCCHEGHAKENSANAYYVGLIPVPSNYPPIAFREYPAPPSVPSMGSWPCVTCPVVAYAPTVVNSYYYCCCFLPGNRSNCHCKIDKISSDGCVGVSSSLRRERGESECSECTSNDATDLRKMCNKRCSSADDNKDQQNSGSMLKDLLLMPPSEKEHDETQ